MHYEVSVNYIHTHAHTHTYTHTTNQEECVCVDVKSLFCSHTGFYVTLYSLLASWELLSFLWILVMRSLQRLGQLVVQGLQNGYHKRHSTHYSPLNFDLTLASLYRVATCLKWVQVQSLVASRMTFTTTILQNSLWEAVAGMCGTPCPRSERPGGTLWKALNRQCH